ncbi:MAG: tetratricopeptide repeat protein [Anaerolineaceae bacterium]
MSDPKALIHACQLYLPKEIQAALAHGIELPGQAHGAALFADISGFTPLTEALTRALGLRRGAEELPIYLDKVYDGLIAEVHRYGGSVVGFAGDAITCWFDDEPVGSAIARPGAFRATVCAEKLQAVMANFAAINVPDQAAVALSVKVAVVCGPIRRFVVGDPAIQRIELIAGQTVLRMAAAEHQASKGEIILDQTTADLLKDQLAISAWHEADGQRFAVLEKISAPHPNQLPDNIHSLTLDQVKSWVLPAVYARLASGLGDYLTELRPVVALFLRFGGIDFDGDPAAGQKLDAYIRWVQAILSGQEAVLTHPTIGDKGSFLCIAFGAPIAHEDDPRRAAATALKLSQPPPELDFITSIQIGLSQGIARTGSYGGGQRRTYDVLGDQVNLAARLMVNAPPGSILVSERMRDSLSGDFSLQELPAIMVKGKSLPVVIFRLTGTRQRGESGLDEFMRPARQLIDRTSELERLQSLLADASAGHGVICQLTGPAGIGKSLLAGRAMSMARERGVQLLAAACSSNSSLAPYRAWQPVFRRLLGLSSKTTKPDEYLEKVIIEQNPHWRVRLPLLGALVGVDLPDNRTTAAMDAGSRHEATLTLAVDLIQSYVLNHPLMIVLEDCQWMDEASSGLLLALGRVMAEMPVLLLVTHRAGADWPVDLNELAVSQVLELGPLNETAIGELITDQLGREKTIDRLTISVIQSQVQGNPSFAGQLVGLMVESGCLVEKEAHVGLSEVVINALRDSDCIEKDLDSGEWQVKKGAHIPTSAIGVPDNVQAIMLARVDRLSEKPKMTLKVASVIGRTFPRKILLTALPTATTLPEVNKELQQLQERGFLEKGPHPDEYAFILNALHEVIYSALPTAQQESLHAAVGQALETHTPGDINGLAYHFTRAGEIQQPKALGYLDQAARGAQRNYANHTALNYYRQGLSLETRWEWLRGQAEVLHLLGVREEERESIDALAKISKAPVSVVYKLLYELNQAVGDYPAAVAAGERLLAESRATGNRVGEVESLRQLGLVKRKQGDNQTALASYRQAQSVLEIQTDLDQDARRVRAQLLNNLGYLLSRLGQPEESRQTLTEAARQAVALEDRYLEANILQDLGLLAQSQRDFVQARAKFTRVTELAKDIGCRNWEALAYINLAAVASESGSLSDVVVHLKQALRLLQVTGDTRNETIAWNELGIYYQDIGQYQKADEAYDHAFELCVKIGNRSTPIYILINRAIVTRYQGKPDETRKYLRQGLKMAETAKDAFMIAAYHNQLGLYHLQQGKLQKAAEYAAMSLKIRKEIGSDKMAPDDLVILAQVSLGSKDEQKALDLAQQTIQMIRDCNGEGPENPMLDAHLAFQVFESLNETDAAREALQLAYDLVQQRAVHIQEPDLRASFLQNVPINAKIIKDASRLELTEGIDKPVWK